MPDRQPGKQPHKRFERRLVLWLAVTYVAIALMSLAVMLYAAVPIFRRRK
jgi:hypothetical protein